jgi:hypothetical protein
LTELKNSIIQNLKRNKERKEKEKKRKRKKVIKKKRKIPPSREALASLLPPFK